MTNISHSQDRVDHDGVSLSVKIIHTFVQHECGYLTWNLSVDTKRTWHATDACYSSLKMAYRIEIPCRHIKILAFFPRAMKGYTESSKAGD